MGSEAMDYRQAAREVEAEMAATPPMTQEEWIAHQAELAREDAEHPECEWCGREVRGGASAFAPYCSEACRNEAAADDAITDWAGLCVRCGGDAQDGSSSPLYDGLCADCGEQEAEARAA